MRRRIATAGLMILGIGNGCVFINPTDPYRPIENTTFVSHKIMSISGSVSSQPKQAVTLSEAIELALKNNPDISEGEYNIQAAQANRDVAVGEYFPSVHAIGGYNRYLDSQRLIPAHINNEPGVFDQDLFATDLVLQMPLFTGGRITSNVRASDLLRQSVEHRLGRTREELAFNVSSVFYTILKQQKVVESLKFSIKALQEQRRRIEALMVVHKVAKVDLLRTEVRLANLDQLLIRETNVINIQNRVLANLLGTAEVVAIDGELDRSLVQADTDVESQIGLALSRRADYLAGISELKAQAARVDAARGEQWPTVFLQGAYGRRWAPSPTSRPAGTDTSEDVASIGVFMDFPIFEGGRIKAKIREEKAQLGAIQERLRKLELQIRLDVEQANLNIVAAKQQIQATEKAVEQAKESLRIEQEKYDLGKGTITDILDAQSAMLQAETSYFRSLSDFQISRAQLRLATGEDIK